MIVAPDRSLVQRMEALQKGNDIRIRRANFKKQMKKTSRADNFERTITIIIEPPEFMETMKVYDLLMATRTFGKIKTLKYLRACEISPSKTLGGMTQRQRTTLVRGLRYGL